MSAEEVARAAKPTIQKYLRDIELASSTGAKAEHVKELFDHLLKDDDALKLMECAVSFRRAVFSKALELSEYKQISEDLLMTLQAAQRKCVQLSRIHAVNVAKKVNPIYVA